MAYLFFILLSVPGIAQRHLPETQIFRSPGLLLTDTTAETPAVYDGSGAIPLLAEAESVEIQIFAPREGRRRCYGYGFSVERAPGDGIPLQITSARDWEGRELMTGIPDNTLSFSATRLDFAPIPATGHVMTLTLTATSDIASPPAPLDIQLTVTLVSDPPRRVNQLISRRRLTWE